MRVRLLPSSPVASTTAQALTTFMVDDHLAIDAGSVGIALEEEPMRKVTNVVVTHTHIDHIASLPILVAEVFDTTDTSVTVHGLPEVLDGLRKHIFNGHVWPDFEAINLPRGGVPALEYREARPGEPFDTGEYRITLVPVNHTVPTAAVFVESGDAAVGFTSDTYVTDEFWAAASRMPALRAIFVDVSYPNEMESLAALAKHLTPQSLEKDLRKLDREVEVYAVHVKQSSRDEVSRQLREIRPPVNLARIGHTYRW